MTGKYDTTIGAPFDFGLLFGFSEEGDEDDDDDDPSAWSETWPDEDGMKQVKKDDTRGILVLVEFEIEVGIEFECAKVKWRFCCEVVSDEDEVSWNIYSRMWWRQRKMHLLGEQGQHLTT